MRNDAWANLIALVIAALLFLTIMGCSDPITSGTVVEKIHQPKEVRTVMVPIRVGKTTVMSPRTRTREEKWILVVRGYTESGERKTRQFRVDEETYLSYRNGERFVPRNQ